MIDDKQEQNLEIAFSNEEERQEVLREIERLTADTQKLVNGAAAKALKAVPRGVWFPLLINLFSIGLFAGGLVGAQWYFGQRQQEIQVQTQQAFSVEGRLVAKLLEESQKRLREQQEQINQIQSEFERLAREKENLAGQFDQQLRDREARLRQELENKLNAERARLQQQGLSPAEIDRRLREFENRQNQELEQTLRRAREEAEREIRAREEQLANLSSALERARQAEQETRRQIEAQSQSRTDALQTQLSEQAAFLEQMSREREAEVNILRQIEAGLTEVRRGLEVDTNTALERLGVVDNLLAVNLNNASENLARRLRPLQTASNAIRESLNRISVREVVEVSGKDPRIEQLSGLVAQARDEPARRAELWERAVGLIEEVAEANRGLRQLDEERRRIERIQREQDRLNRVRQILGGVNPEDTATWEKLSDAIAPADAALYEVELREAVQKVLNQGLILSRRPNTESLRGLEEELQNLRRLNQSLTERSQAAEERTRELEGLVADLRKQLEELRAASGDNRNLLEQIESARRDLTQLNRELEDLRKSRDEDSRKLSEREKALKDLNEEKTRLLAEVARLGEELRGRESQLSSVQAIGDDLAELQAYRSRIESFRQAYNTAAQEALRSLSQARNQAEFDQAVQKLSQSIRDADKNNLLSNFNQLLNSLASGPSRFLVKPEEVTQARKKALNDVLTLTTYLRGNSGRGEILSAELRNMSLRDADFATVVKSIQELTVRGAEEAPVPLAQWRAIGSVVSAVGERLNIDILTSPEAVVVGLRVQIRRAGNTDQVLAEGRITSVSGGRAQARVTSRTENQRLPIGGDVVYLEVP